MPVPTGFRQASLPQFDWLADGWLRPDWTVAGTLGSLRRATDLRLVSKEKHLRLVLRDIAVWEFPCGFISYDMWGMCDTFLPLGCSGDGLNPLFRLDRKFSDVRP